jgi:AcrR family transcriptional regulator
MVRRQVDVRREEILDATVEHVRMHGLASTRVSDVAAALACSTSLVFYHFGTKDDLLVAAFEHAAARDLAQLDAAVARGTDPLDRLRRVVRLYGPTGAAVGWRIWIDAWASALRDPAIRRTLRRLEARWNAVLRAIIEEGAADGTFTVKDAAATVAKVSALFDGLTVGSLVYGSVTRRQLRGWIAEMLAAELGVDVDALT